MTLIELIKKAQAGEKFKAKNPYSILVYYENCFIQIQNWTKESVLADWTIIKEPEVVEFELDCKEAPPGAAMLKKGNGPNYLQHKRLIGKKWKVVCTEVVE